MTIRVFPKSILYGIISLLILMPLAGCSLSNTQPYSKSGLYFDTIVSVDIFGARDDPQQILDECMNICSRYEALFDKNTDTSDIARINSAGTDPVPVDHETALLISDALKYSEISGGRFDITIEPVSSLWDFHEGGEHIPEEDLIKSALTHVDHNRITRSIQQTILSPNPKPVSQ